MYDKYMIVGDYFKNVAQAGEVTGFQLGMRLPYYRGVVLSLLGETDLAVDGEHFSPDQMMVTLEDRTYKLSDLENETEDKWEFGDVGVLTVNKPGGLTPGEHQVELSQLMIISYILSFGGKGFYGRDSKQLTLID